MPSAATTDTMRKAFRLGADGGTGRRRSGRPGGVSDVAAVAIASSVVVFDPRAPARGAEAAGHLLPAQRRRRAGREPFGVPSVNARPCGNVSPLPRPPGDAALPGRPAPVQFSPVGKTERRGGPCWRRPRPEPSSADLPATSGVRPGAAGAPFRPATNPPPRLNALTIPVHYKRTLMVHSEEAPGRRPQLGFIDRRLRAFEDRTFTAIM